MSRIPQDYDGWLTKSKHDYYSTTVEAKEAPELIWNCALKPWMRDVERYEIGWGDREALQDALGEIYERYGPVELVTEFHDVRGRIWVGCYYGATEVRNEERKQIFLCTKIKDLFRDSPHSTSSRNTNKSVMEGKRTHDEHPQDHSSAVKANRDTLPSSIADDGAVQEKALREHQRQAEKMDGPVSQDEVPKAPSCQIFTPGPQAQRVRRLPYHSRHFSRAQGKENKIVRKPSCDWVEVDGDVEEEDWTII